MLNLRNVFFGQNATLKTLEMAFPGIGFQTFSGGAYPRTTLGFGWGKEQPRSDFQLDPSLPVLQKKINESFKVSFCDCAPVHASDCLITVNLS